MLDTKKPAIYRACPPHKKHAHYPALTRKVALRRVHAGEEPADVACSLNIESSGVILRWLDYECEQAKMPLLKEKKTSSEERTSRFVDENLAVSSQESFIDAFLNIESPRSVWAIVDTNGAANLGWNTSYFEDPSEDEAPYLAPDRVAVADNIDELADMIDVSAESLTSTINTYNSYVASGLDEEFGKEGLTTSIETGPFYAVKMRLFAHDQMGGIVANTKAQVCKRSEHYGPDAISLDDQEIIPHLYAAGECVGGYFGADRGHGKISCYMFYGKTAGENAAKEEPID